MFIIPEMTQGLYELAEASCEAGDTPEQYKAKKLDFIKNFKTKDRIYDGNMVGFLNKIISKSHVSRATSTYRGVEQYDADILIYIQEKLSK